MATVLKLPDGGFQLFTKGPRTLLTTGVTSWMKREYLWSWQKQVQMFPKGLGSYA